MPLFTGERLSTGTSDISTFRMDFGGIRAKDIEKYRVENKLTWHELNDGEVGEVGEINAGAFEPGGFEN